MRNKILLLLGLSIIGNSFALASEEMFQNNLLKMDVSKTSLGGVKVTLYTKKPYTDSVIVNKKGDNEYVILMPETANSLTAKPTIKSTSDVVKNVEVKTQQYASGGQKGYTKIIVSTSKPIEITSSVQTVKSPQYTLSESEYKELMAQATKKMASKATQKTTSNLAVKQTSKKITTKIASKESTEKAKAPIPRPKKLVQRLTQNNIEQKLEQKFMQKPVGKTDKKAPAVVKTPVKVPVAAPTKTAVSTPVEAPKTVKAQEPTPQNSQNVVTPPATETPTITAKTPSTNLSTTQVPVDKYQKYKNKIKNHLPLAVGIALIPILLLFLLFRIAGKTAQRIKEQKEAFESHLNEKPETPINYSEKIDEEMDWKEKFQTYVETSTVTTAEQPQETIISENQDLDNLFSDEPMPTTGTATEEIYEEEQTEFPTGLNYEDFNEITNENLSVDEIFGDEEDEIFLCDTEENETLQEEFLIQQEPEEEVEEVDEYIQSQFKIDEDKSFYLIDFEGSTALVGQIGEEIFALKRFDDPIKGALQARLNEKKGIISTYMVKADKFKALVEVSPESMNLLIEL